MTKVPYLTPVPDTPPEAPHLPGLAPQLQRLIDAEIALDDIPAAYARLLDGKAEGLKTIIRVPRPPS